MKTLELKGGKLYIGGEEITNMKHYSIYGNSKNDVAELNICMDVALEGDSFSIQEVIERDDYSKNLEGSIRKMNKAHKTQIAVLIVQSLCLIGLIANLVSQINF
ncbi:hypothetical protein CLOSCI_00321 [[Clostridium] scindens ATCC 35704]|uniref:Uncharacterized protein n=1 Tax=Clostridium scindens (strain ATCC 35704 / DSM 5676 / VPI 13733 / 19) TaxID=411468 RepID=B0NA54_CLOS5|nr:hypothetical protein [[Clostridium] scindens]EDS08547.1 hypothetical protein CLOSCI_00321 [[Clostridium] scindens ATCC 35704]QBF72989.1 hypothetical protein HDCHBGLK_00335 [[Clostridium] scindens ATCC 35704]QRO36347.1 hypothetical protein I6J57_13945 [[Clostridium] scindens]